MAKKNAIVNNFNADEAFVSASGSVEIVKKGKYRVFNGSEYETVHLQTSAEQVIESESKKFVSQAEKNTWNSKADANHSHDSVYAKLDETYNKTQVDTKLGEKADATHGHAATNIITDSTHKFVTDAEKTKWNDTYSTTEIEGLIAEVDNKLTDYTATNEAAHSTITKNYQAADKTLQGNIDTVQNNLESEVERLVELINNGGSANTELAQRVATIENTTIPGVRKSVTDLDAKLSGQISNLDEAKADKTSVTADIAAATTALESKIKVKADKTYVDNKLDLKANAADVYSKTEVNGQLELKADVSFVNAELGKKVNTTTFNTELAKKADQATVTTELAKKANQADMNTALEGKAEKSHTHIPSQITGLGTAATKDVGTASGQIPVLNGKGKIDTALLPEIVMNQKYTASSITAAMEIEMQIGDILILENAVREAIEAQVAKAATYEVGKPRIAQELSEEYTAFIASGKMAYLCVDPKASSFEDRFKPLQSSGDTISAGEVQAALSLKLDKLEFNTYKGQVSDSLNLKADKSTTYTIEQVDTSLAGKVDKVIGKQLSTNDFTDALKVKLEGIAEGANNYVHPTGDGNLHVPATGTTNNGKVLMAGSSAGALSWTALTTANVSDSANKRYVTDTQIALWTSKADAVHKHDEYRLISDSFSKSQTTAEINKMKTIISTTQPSASSQVAGAVWIEEQV